MKLFIFFALLAFALARHHSRPNQLRDEDIGAKIKQAYVDAIVEVHGKFFKDTGCSLKDWEAFHNAKKSFEKQLGDLACESENNFDEEMGPDPDDEMKRGKQPPKKVAYFEKALESFRNATNLTLSDSCTNKEIIKSYGIWMKNARAINQIFRKHLDAYKKEIEYYHSAVYKGFVAGGKLVQEKYFQDSKCNLKDLGKIFHLFRETIAKIALEKGIEAVANLEEPTPEENQKINAFVRHWKRKARVSCGVEDIKGVWMTMYENARDIKKILKASIIKSLQDAQIPVPEEELEDSCESEDEERDFFEENSVRKYDLYHEISKRDNINRMGNLFRY